MKNRPKKKILFIETGMGFGGSAISLKEIVLNMKNFTPVIVFYAKKSDYFTKDFSSVPAYYLGLRFTYQQKGTVRELTEKYSKSAVLSKLAVKIFSLFSYLEDKITIFKIIKLVKKEGIELIHINNRIDPIAINAAIKCNIPCIVHSRGHDATPAKKRHLEYICNLIAPTKKIADHDIQNSGVPESKISVLYDTVDVDSFAKNSNREMIRSAYEIVSKTIVIGMFARIVPMKGQMVLAEAIKKLHMRGQNVTCMFIGDSSDYGVEYLEKLKLFISHNNLKDSFIFAGYQNDTASYYAAADIVVHPSIDEEAFGRIIIEAWAARKPIIASDIGASVELIDNEYTGILVTKANATELADAIERLINDRNIYRRLVDNATDRVERFQTNHLINEIEAIYERALEIPKFQ